jgi:nucleotide-binding universal stress UspA family protein
MAGVILVVLDHPPATQALLDAARQLAEHCGAARINTMVVREPPETLISPSEEVLTEPREEDLRALEAGRAGKVREVFDAWAATMPSSVKVQWIDIDGIAELLVEERGRRADYIVVEQPSRSDYGTSWHALRAALFTTNRPVLLVPAGHAQPFGQRIAMAWRDDERATRAVLSALRAFPRAAQRFVLAGTRGADVVLPPILAEHGVTAELNALPIGGGMFGEVLLRKTHELGADLLVMGAYQHHPLRELLLGGVTRYMLLHADLPVMLQH